MGVVAGRRIQLCLHLRQIEGCLCVRRGNTSFHVPPSLSFALYSRRQHSLSLLTESDDKDTEKKLFFVRLSLPTSQFAFYPCLLSRQSFVCIYTTMGVFPKYVIQVEV